MKNQQTTQASTLRELEDYLTQGNKYCYDAEAGAQIIQRMRAEYGRKHALRQDILQAQQEGIFEVTIKSASKTITLQVAATSTGYHIGDALEEELCKGLDKLNIDIIRQLIDEEQTVAQYGPENQRKPHSAAVHALCLPPQPAEPSAKMEGDRCPFLPATR